MYAARGQHSVSALWQNEKQMDTKLLELLVCPASKGALIYMREQQELWCAVSQLAYPIKDDIPMMVVEEARQLSDTEVASLSD